MDKDRQAEVFRAIVKDMLRKKGLRFDKNEELRNLGQEEKDFNERHKLNHPLTKIEFLELYLELMKELADEHFANIASKIAELKSDNK